MKIINVMGVGVIGHATAEVLRRLGHQVSKVDPIIKTARGLN